MNFGSFLDVVFLCCAGKCRVLGRLLSAPHTIISFFFMGTKVTHTNTHTLPITHTHSHIRKKRSFKGNLMYMTFDKTKPLKCICVTCRFKTSQQNCLFLENDKKKAKTKRPLRFGPCCRYNGPRMWWSMWWGSRGKTGKL